ncbi:IKI3 protein [Phytophthora cactorum]|nr:IKI3 protein [Phytophthora cactorum]
MRNLVSLQPSSSPDVQCVAFASIPGDAQVFFLRSSGRIESLQLDEQDAHSPSKELELFLDLREFVEDSDACTGCWRWMSYVAELGMLVCASTGGALVSVDVDTRDGEEVGSVDSGLIVQWPTTVEVLHETELERSLPSELELGTPRQDQESWYCELCWREDANVVHKVLVFTEQLEFHALGRLEDGRLALIASCEAEKGRLVVVFFERNGLRHEAAGRLNVVACSSHAQALTFYEHEFVWDICSVEAEQLALSSTPGEDQEVASQRQSVAVTGVIDGSKLLLTPLHLAMVPPPFALLQATFEAAINSVVFDSQTEALLVLLANGDVILVENYLTPADTRAAAAGLPPPRTLLLEAAVQTR